MPTQLLKSMESLKGGLAMVQRMSKSRELHDLDARFRVMDSLGDYRQIFSLLNPPLETITTPEEGRELARIANDGMAEVVSRHPKRFAAFVAALPFHDMESNLAELKRAVETLGASGIQIFTNVNGRPLDDPQF